MSTQALYRGDGFVVRSATPEDNAALCGLLRRVPMEGEVSVVQERDPDFFRFAEMHLGVSQTIVACLQDTGEVVGCGTYVLRDAHFPDGVRRRVGYICDIRTLPAVRGARLFPRLGRAGLEHARDVHGVEVFMTAVVDSNRRMTGVATSRSPRRTDQPVSRPMTPYHMVSVLFAGPPPERPARIERGRREDVDELADFLARRQAARTFGYVVDRALLESRFATWPAFQPESFHVIRDGRGRIVACAAPWETSSFRRLRVVRYGWRMRAFRSAYNLLAQARGGVGLPAAGECFRYACLSHLEVAGDDPELLNELLRSAYRDLAARGLHFLSVMVPRGSPLERGFRGFFVDRMPMTLYATSLAGSRWNDADLRTSRPGFEMALA